MILHHYSSTPHLTLGTIRPSRRFFMKPGGIWLSDDSRDNGWADWCADNGFRLEKLAWRYEVEISDGIPVIGTFEDFTAFNREYAESPKDFKSDFLFIDWKRVMRDMPGIVFSPFVRDWAFTGDWAARDYMRASWWYSAIDCDSACVWDKRKVVSMGQAERFEPDSGFPELSC